ncbi:MAG: 4-hydroxy-tetrahydrodipicolinate reductase [Bacteroidota bacterium]|jgi:4-hydroxy-tetrahydrodipicolinate reductase
MNIALIGYGKMGKAIETIALERGHKIVLKISSDNQHEFTEENIKQADVAIEFSTPHTAFDNVMRCMQFGVPVICGSTAWLDKLPEAEAFARDNKIGFIYASNFSIGVNIFFAINEQLAQLMSKQPQYNVAVEEIHHTAKLDAPSGTAVTIAQGILANLSSKQQWVNDPSESAADLYIKSIRQDPAPGTHSVHYTSAIDDIEIKHTAHNRVGFATGAVVAAEFIKGKQGVYAMRDVLFA